MGVRSRKGDRTSGAGANGSAVDSPNGSKARKGKGGGEAGWSTGMLVVVAVWQLFSSQIH